VKFHATGIAGAFIIEPEPRGDDRGYLARTYCVSEFREHGLDFAPVQSYQSRSHRKGTIRGLHYQVDPSAESKLVRCVAGAIYDVVLDMRPKSPTYLHVFGVELSADNRLAIYVPSMIAHGTQALTDGAELLCLTSHAYAPQDERGVRYDDEVLGENRWPLPAAEVSAKDLAWAHLLPATAPAR
jgi:dTDP-4-dehydrorhamnose 3,5-epimerase